MEEHDLFFQRIIGLIPRELYNAKEDDDSLNTRYFKHRIQPLEASERKLLSKKRKLEKYGGAAEGDNEEEDDGENDDEDDDVDEDDEDDSEQDDDEQDAENDDEEENEKPVPMKVVDNSNLSSDPKVRLRVSLALLKIGNGLRSELISSIDAS
jgi:cobalamin biosynthesis protein CobT